MMPSAKKRRCCNAGPQFNSCTINMYFAPVPAPPPTEEAPKSLFASNAERIKRTSIVKKGKSYSVLVWQSTSDGKIKAGCQNCSKHFVDLSNFAPMDGSSNSQGARTKFDAAYAAYQAAYAAGDRDECIAQRGMLEALRCTKCFDCRPDQGHLTPSHSQCKDYYDTMRKTMAVQHDGCQNPDCPERGEESWCILTADHGTNPKKRDKNDDPVCLGAYSKWPLLGGVPAMMEEAKQIHQWICHCCHAIEPTSNSGNRCADPATMPVGKRSGTKEELQQYNARRMAVRKYPKLQYVDAAKRRIGQCAACARPVVPGAEVMHEFNHLDEASKSKGGLFGPRGGVAGLVAKLTNAATLDKVKTLLDDEMAKCNLLCKNCHHRHTNKYPPRATAF